MPLAPSTPRDTRGRPISASEKPDGTKATLYSHDWSDPTTWYEASVEVVDETATDGGLHTTYSLAHVNVIDSYHGKITQEDYLLDAAGHSYPVLVKVNDATKTERDPHLGTGGDYSINYAAGTITFFSALEPGDVVTATYHYATSSLFTVKPTAGKRLTLDFVEVQFATDVEITDSVTFQPRGYVDVFAPQLMGEPYNLPSGTLIPLGNPLVYKGMRDYMNDAVRSYVAYPALGGVGWRGMTQETVIFDWDYTRATPLSSAAGMEVQIKLQHDVPFVGSYATATFYCASEVE